MIRERNNWLGRLVNRKMARGISGQFWIDFYSRLEKLALAYEFYKAVSKPHTWHQRDRFCSEPINTDYCPGRSRLYLEWSDGSPTSTAT